MDDDLVIYFLCSRVQMAVAVCCWKLLAFRWQWMNSEEPRWLLVCLQLRCSVFGTSFVQDQWNLGGGFNQIFVLFILTSERWPIWLYVLDGLKPRRRWRLCTVVVNSIPMNARMAAIHCGSCHLPCRPSQPRWRPRQWPQQWLQPRQLPPCRLLRCRFRCGSTWHIKVMTKFTTYLIFWRFNVMFDPKMLHRSNS